MGIREQLEDYFYQVLEADLLLRLCPDEEDTIYQIVDLLVDTCATNRKTLRIAGDDKHAEVVRSRLKKLNADHISFVLDSLAENTAPVRNMKQYLLAMLYNAPTTMNLYQLTTTKESNIRDVDVAPEYMDFLKEYYKYWKSQKKLMGGSWQKSLDKKSSKYAPSLLALRGTDFVICNDHGFPINPDSYGALVRMIGQRAGIEGLHPHMFRHTFVSILLSNPNIGVATVAAEAGHAQPSTTLAIYTQVYDKRRKEIRSQMSKELYE